MAGQLPFDYSQDSRFPGSRIVRESPQPPSSPLSSAPSSSRSSRALPGFPPPPAPVPSSSRLSPVASSSRSTRDAPVRSTSRLTAARPASISPISPHPAAAPSSASFAPPPPDPDVVMRALRQKSFPIFLKPSFSCISGFVPGFDPRNVLSRRVRVLFVENVEHILPENPEAGIFISEATIDIAHYKRLSRVLSRNILKRGSASKGKVRCLISTWVSRKSFLKSVY